MIRRTIAICCMSLLFVSCGTSTSEKQDLPTYRIGYMICNSEQETLHRFLPFTKYLSEKLGVNFEPVAIDTIKFMKEVDNLDFTHSNSLLYIMMHKFHGVDILAAEKKGSLGFRSQGVILTRRDSGIKKIEDFPSLSIFPIREMNISVLPEPVTPKSRALDFSSNCS